MERRAAKKQRFANEKMTVNEELDAREGLCIYTKEGTNDRLHSNKTVLVQLKWFTERFLCFIF